MKRIDIEKWLRDTAGFTIDHLKELVCLVYVHKRKYETALEEVRSMVNGPAIKNTSGADKRKVGFKSRNDDDDDRKKKQ